MRMTNRKAGINLLSIGVEEGEKPYCYFLGFSDEDAKQHNDAKCYFEKMRDGFRRVRQMIGSHFRVLCVSRDDYDEIRLGFSSTMEFALEQQEQAIRVEMKIN